MARRSQCSDAGDNPLDPNYLPPHYREEYRLAIDSLVEEGVDGYYKFLQLADVVDFLSSSETDYIQNSVQVPNQVGHPEHHFLDTSGEGSSDTYWPLHSDLDAPGLDLGWPQIHHFIGPTEVTTLVNPAAPDMPSIKEQARRLIKNAQMVIAIVMDMFTDVDIFADILKAAMRNVAIYILLDEANVDHFIHMVNSCRVNLQSIQFLRVRTVSGITYHCRSGKSFKGQMLDRFILTDCRAVLSGNYSFMWSYEKLHRCMAHLFLGQLVSTFDEEFRILFAQSEPLIIENMEDINILQKPFYPGERPTLRDTRKYRTMDTGHPEDFPRQSYDQRMDMDWRMIPLKRQETFHGPMDVYNKYSSPQTRQEPQFDQGPPRMPMVEGLAHKRYGFGEGASGRYNLPYQQGLPDVEPQGRPYYRGQPLHPGQVDEPDHGGYNKGGYDKFWNQDFHQEEQYPEPGYPQEIEPHEGYDPVINYPSSTRKVDIDQSSDKLIPGPDLPYTTTHPRRGIGQPYACQISPTPSNTTEKKSFQDHTNDRKDPTVKRGLRNWRISSYLSAYDNSGEPEGLPMGPGQTIDPFEEFPNPIQQPSPPPAVEIPRTKIPNVREFKVPALTRASQIPAFAKTTSRDLPKKPSDEPPPFAVPVLGVPEPTKTTPTPSESSSTTDGEKQDEVEPREPKVSALRREESFRRNYNAAVQRSSRLRSSLIFTSLDQNTSQDNCKTAPGEQEEGGTKVDTEQTKLPFVSQVLAQRRSGAREPFEWRGYIKTTDNAKTEEDSGKQTEKDLTTDSKLNTLSESQETLKPQDVASNVQKIDVSLPKPEQPKIELLPPLAQQQPTKSFLNEPFLDMNDPDQRLMFFKELAATRRAEKAAEEARLKQESDSKVKKNEPKKEEKDVAGPSKQDFKKPTEDAKKTEANTQDVSAKSDKPESVLKKDPAPTPSCEKIKMKAATDSEKIESKQSPVGLPVSVVKQMEDKQPKLEITVSKPTVQQDKPIDPPVAATPANAEQVTEQKTTSEATSKAPQLKTSTSVPDFGKIIGSDLLSSLPSSRIYERSMSQEKDVQPKSRLWSPLLHKRELLNPYSDNKQKSMSTVIQIEESPEETATSDKSAKALVLPAISEKEQSQNRKTLVRSLSSGTQDKVKAKEPLTLDKSKIVPSTLDKTQPEKESTENPIQPLPAKETLDKESLVQSTASEDSTDTSKGATQLPSEKPQPHQSKESLVQSSGVQMKESEQMPGLSQPKQSLEKEKSISGVEKVGHGIQKQDKLQSVMSTGQETSATSPPISEKTKLQEPVKQHEEKAAEKPSGEADEGTKKSSQTDTKSAISREKLDRLPTVSEKADPKQSDKETIEETRQMATSSDKDSTKNTVHAKSSPVTEKEDLTQKVTSFASEKSSSTMQSDKVDVVEVSQPVEEAKLKSPIIYTEELTQLEFHSNTSSPASFATALEFMSSEESDVHSPAKMDPHHLFRTGNLDYHSSSVSDLSDFGTPNSDLSGSPMPATNLDAATEDNISVAETVIEAASRHISASTEGVNMDIESTKPFVVSQQSLPKDESSKSEQIETPQQDLSIETSCDTNLNTTTAQSEAKSSNQDATNQSSTKSNSPAQNENVNSAKPIEEAKMSATQTTFSKEGVETKPVSSPATSQEAKMQGKQSEKSDTDSKGSLPTLEAINSETKAVSSKPQTDSSNAAVVSLASQVTSQVTKETKVADQISVTTALTDKSNIESKTEVSKESTDGKTQDVTSKSETKAVSSPDNQSPTSQATHEIKQEIKLVDKTSEITKDTSKPADKSKEPNTTDSTVKTKDLEAPSKSTSSEKAADQVRQNISEPANVKTNETAPPSQPKQSKPVQSRYLSSTANVISSSNLRDDTKILLEQISANSQNRNESTTTKEAPVTDDEKEDEADKNAKRKKENELKITSLGQQKPSQDRDKVLERIQTMRKDRKVYSRFEV